MQVFHHVTGNFCNEHKPAHWPHADWKLVAEVEGDDPDTAFGLTNHIDSPWTDNPGVTPIGGTRQRSTSVGDIVECKGKLFLCQFAGWEELTFNKDVQHEDFELEARRQEAGYYTQQAEHEEKAVDNS